MTDTDLARLAVYWAFTAVGATLGVLIGWPIVVSATVAAVIYGCWLAYRTLKRPAESCPYRLASGRACLLDAGHPGAHYATIATMHPEGAP